MPSSTPSGIGNVSAAGASGELRVAAAPAGQRDDALAGVRAHARDLGARHERQLGGGEVLVAALVGVGEVHARARDLDQHLARPGHRRGQLDELQHLRPAELALLDRPHEAPNATVPRRMSLTVVGSIAYDAVKTPFGTRERMLGGAATHFALAASFFDEVRVVGPVGDDFAPESWDVLRTRGTLTDDIEHVPGGKTFFWKGEYHDNLNSRETHDTELNVFETFEPKLSAPAQACDVLFLANIQPDLQRAVREQCGAARFVAMDSMDLWINIARESLVRTIEQVDCVILNDEELRAAHRAARTSSARRARS